MKAIMNNPPLNSRRKSLRTFATDAERKLWSKIRAKRFFNLKFRRQQSIDSYIVDFYCAEKKLIIEIDGGQHAKRKEYDFARTVYLNSLGMTVMRFWNNEVLSDIDSVLEFIKTTLSLPSPLDKGEG